MNAVAIMTPDPKYFAMRKANGGTYIPFALAAMTGKMEPEYMN